MDTAGGTWGKWKLSGNPYEMFKAAENRKVGAAVYAALFIVKRRVIEIVA